MPRSKGRTGRPWRRLQQWVWANFTHCYRCGEYVDQTIPNPRHPRARSVDHIIPLHLGGEPLSHSNATLAHYGCNASHGSRMRHRVTTRTTPTRARYKPAPATPPVLPSRVW